MSLNSSFQCATCLIFFIGNDTFYIVRRQLLSHGAVTDNFQTGETSEWAAVRFSSVEIF
jgi:hypothetical protein